MPTKGSENCFVGVCRSYADIIKVSLNYYHYYLLQFSLLGRASMDSSFFAVYKNWSYPIEIKVSYLILIKNRQLQLTNRHFADVLLVHYICITFIATVPWGKNKTIKSSSLTTSCLPLLRAIIGVFLAL